MLQCQMPLIPLALHMSPPPSHSLQNAPPKPMVQKWHHLVLARHGGCLDKLGDTISGAWHPAMGCFRPATAGTAGEGLHGGAWATGLARAGS